MNKYYYKKIIQSNKKPSKIDYIKILSDKYKSKHINLNINNKFNNEFIIFIDALKKPINEYNKLTKECITLRDSDKTSYFNKFLVSEINSSLKIEGINSSRKIVDEIIKNKNKEIKDKKEIEQLIWNMKKSINLILSTNEINVTNIFSLYLTMTNNIKMDPPLKKLKFYREDGVTIGYDKGTFWKDIPNRMNEFVFFINSDLLNNTPIVKALVAHYIFEHIHPYFDFNGRVGRIIHLWILKSLDTNELWKNIYLSESIYAYKEIFNKAFNKMNTAKELNIDLTLWVDYILDIFINHNKAYIKMKKLSNKSKVIINEKARLFLLDIIIQMEKNKNKWFNKKDFEKIYPDYSKTVGDRVMKNLQNSGLFEIRSSNIKEYRLKR